MQDPSLTLRVCSSLHRVLDSLSVNPLAPEIMPLITQVRVFTRLQFDRPRDVAQAVEMAPPIGLTTRRRKSGIFKNIQPRDRCARSRSRIDNAQHMARHFDLQRVFAIIAQRNFAPPSRRGHIVRFARFRRSACAWFPRHCAKRECQPPSSHRRRHFRQPKRLFSSADGEKPTLSRTKRELIERPAFWQKRFYHTVISPFAKPVIVEN